ncbi:MAG: L-2-amino-thiazoline-4-carboxylic acid hydrolase [Dermatophilaceae bacterium]
MLTSQTKGVLLQLGSPSLSLWVRAGGVSEPGLRADTQRTYRQLATRAPWPDQHVNRVILVFLVLPMAALYTVLRERGRTEQQALEVVTDAVGAVVVGPERRVIRMLVSTDLGRRLIVRAEASAAGALLALGAPTWEATFIERSEHRMALDVTRCYIRDTLSQLDAAPAVVAMCSHDISAFADLSSQLRLSRTGTLGTGADRCDFCLEVLPAKPRRAAHQGG